jgi:hypothetical protein
LRGALEEFVDQSLIGLGLLGGEAANGIPQGLKPVFFGRVNVAAKAATPKGRKMARLTRRYRERGQDGKHGSEDPHYKGGRCGEIPTRSG